MKSTSILSIGALIASAAASTGHSNAHAIADLMARAIDPATMDPTKFSVLSVLKTAMPTPTGTETGISLPTGDVAPQWYKDLPPDVMVLLAQMYPATPTATASVSETAAASSTVSSSVPQATASVSASQTTLSSTSGTAPTATATGNSNSNSTLSTNNDTSVNGTLSTTKPSPSQSAISTGAKNTVGTKSWSVVVGFGVAALFCLVA